MTKSDIKHTVSIILAAVALCCTFFGGIALAEEEEEDALALYSGWQEESTSASRSPKPLSQSPENITIVTARDIEIINAHTLADVLATIPGIQTHVLGGPGSSTYTYIQGASFPHTLVMLDGAPLNKISNFSDVGSVPARIIERIEIVKGSASSAWGPALGGVINVITKSPDKRPVSGAPPLP
jgi:vitamin B12 transporter